MNNYPTLTKSQIEAACRPYTNRPITKWHTNADGTITAINDLGQKYIITITHLNDLIDTPPPAAPTPLGAPTLGAPSPSSAPALGTPTQSRCRSESTSSAPTRAPQPRRRHHAKK